MTTTRPLATPLESAIPFRNAGTGERERALLGAEVLVSSRALPWPGMLAEAGRNDSWETSDLVTDGHYLVVNLAEEPLSFEQKGEHGFERVVMAPGTLWLNPHGRPFSHRIRERCHYGALTLDPEHLARLLEIPGVELTCHYGREDAALAHLLRALLAEASREAPAASLFAESVVAAIGSRLLAEYAVHRRTLGGARGGLVGLRHRRLVDHVESHLGDDLALTRLSEVAGLSPYHLAREFKRTTGETLHRYVMGRRLERARDSLRRGGPPISELARDLGFADQSHLTRLFRARFGTTPAAFARAHRPGLVLLGGSPQGDAKTASRFKKERGGKP